MDIIPPIKISLNDLFTDLIKGGTTFCSYREKLIQIPIKVHGSDGHLIAW